MRGYLWECLAEEVVEEFAGFGEPVDVMRQFMNDAAYGFAVANHPGGQAIQPRGNPKSNSDRCSSFRARRKVDGLCSCGAMLDPKSTSSCTVHLERERERARARRDKRRAMREHLPDTREAVIHRFRITDANDVVHAGYIRAGVYEDGRLGEVFVSIGKPGESSTWADQWGLAVSVALQFGASVDTFLGKFVGQRLEPSGSTTCKEIPRCTSVVDYVARWLLLKYGDVASRVEAASP